MLFPQRDSSEIKLIDDLCQIKCCEIKEIRDCVDLNRDYRDPDNRYYWIVSSGVGYAVVNHEKFKLCPGTVMMIPANALYRLHLSPEIEGLVFCGSDLFMRTKVATGLYTTSTSFQENYYKPGASYRLAGEKQATKRNLIIDQITSASTRLGMGCDAAVMGYIFVLLADGIIPEVKADEDPPVKYNISYSNLIYDFQILVERHYKEHISIDCYCKLLEVSRVKLIEACKKLLDKTPLEILHDRLMVEAKRQLMITSKRVSDVAYALGFEDSAYFSRFFKNQSYESPSIFRRNNVRY